MAVLNLSVTISDADLPRLMAAARAVFPVPLDENGAPRELVEAEISEYLRQHGIGLMRQLVRNHERAIAMKSAETLEPTIEVS